MILELPCLHTTAHTLFSVVVDFSLPLGDSFFFSFSFVCVFIFIFFSLFLRFLQVPVLLLVSVVPVVVPQPPRRRRRQGRRRRTSLNEWRMALLLPPLVHPSPSIAAAPSCSLYLQLPRLPCYPPVRAWCRPLSFFLCGDQSILSSQPLTSLSLFTPLSLSLSLSLFLSLSPVWCGLSLSLVYVCFLFYLLEQRSNSAMMFHALYDVAYLGSALYGEVNRSTVEITARLNYTQDEFRSKVSVRKKNFRLLCPILFSPFGRPLTHISFFEYLLLFV